MEIVINIDEKVYNNIEPFLNGETIKGGINLFNTLEIIKNGTPLPKGHGRLGDLDALEKLCIEHEIGNSAFDNSPIIEQGHYSDGDCIWKPLFDFATTVIPADIESEDKPKTGHCKGCRWRKDSDEVFRRGVSMESLCASCYVRNKK